MIKEVVLKNRSYRRFYQEKEISIDTLKELVDVGRNTPSGANKQPLRYKLVCSKEENVKVFECLRWAGYYKDWDGPVEGERPSAYIIMLSENQGNTQWDEGIAGQTILLAATEKNLGGCFIGNIDRDKLTKNMEIADNYTIKLVIALGYPKEEVIIDTIDANGDIKYYRDENQIHHVPKICLKDVLI